MEWLLLQYATARAGVILVNVNPAYRSHELRYVLQKSHIRALFLHARDSRANYHEILHESRDGDRLPLEHEILLGDDSWDTMLRPAAISPKTPSTPATSPTSSTPQAPPVPPKA